MSASSQPASFTSFLGKLQKCRANCHYVLLMGSDAPLRGGGAAPRVRADAPPNKGLVWVVCYYAPSVSLPLPAPALATATSHGAQACGHATGWVDDASRVLWVCIQPVWYPGTARAPALQGVASSW